MTVNAHVLELKQKHANLSQEIELIERRPSHDTIKLRALKREKLRLKELIESFAGEEPR